jgi:hypothetical protein
MDSYEGYLGRLIGHLGGIAPTDFPGSAVLLVRVA